MEKFLKFIGKLLFGVIVIILFLLVLTYKTFCFPLLLGLLGLLLPIPVAIDTTNFKKEWKPITFISLISILLVFCAGQLFCSNYSAPDWLFNIFHLGVILFLCLDAVVICTIIILSILKKIKKS